MNEKLKESFFSPNTWLHGIFIVLFIIALKISLFILFVIVFFQFLFSLFTGDQNKRLMNVSKSLCPYINELINYITYHKPMDDKPFPFSDFPKQSE